MQEAYLRKARETLSSRDETLAFLDYFVREGLGMPEGPTLEFARTLFQKSTDTIFKLAESPIELMFFNALHVIACMNGPFVASITPTPASISEYIATLRERIRIIEKMRKLFIEETGLEGYQDFLDGIRQFSAEKADDVKTEVFWYQEMGLADAYHITMQAKFPEIKVMSRGIRADAFVWVPSDPTFNLIVECDGFDYHSDTSAFRSDRVRDRALQAQAYQVFRFSGSEIWNDPFQAALELFEHLQSKRGAA